MLPVAVLAEKDVEAYVLTWESLERMLAEHPQAGQAVLLSVAAQLAARLRRTTADLTDSEHAG